MPKKPPLTAAQRQADERKRLAQTLKRVGIVGKSSKGVKAKRPDFPDLSTDRPGLAPLSNVAAVSGAHLFKRSKSIKVPDGFHIGNSHKQGLAIHSNKEVAWTGGRKT